MTSSPAFVRQPEGNGCIERFFRTLKEQVLWVRHFATIEDLRQALLAFKETYIIVIAVSIAMMIIIIGSSRDRSGGGGRRLPTRVSLDAGSTRSRDRRRQDIAPFAAFIGGLVVAGLRGQAHADAARKTRPIPRSPARVAEPGCCCDQVR